MLCTPAIPQVSRQQRCRHSKNPGRPLQSTPCSSGKGHKDSQEVGQHVLALLKTPEQISSLPSTSSGFSASERLPSSTLGSSLSPPSLQPAARMRTAGSTIQQKDSGPSAGLWEGGYKNKRLGRDVEATCERVYQQSRYPSKPLLRSIHDLHSYCLDADPLSRPIGGEKREWEAAAQG
ncbi:hypothetical protein WJX84_005855 [Apatococcus fuscideae]|uniref:Uncharacterized protein n=1 Tax=Apatococcus fuscideae TaxID=2026836 RepID=A0AAW1TB58_9CHLO